MKEIWKSFPIKEFEGFYEVSNYSRVRNIPRLYQTGNKLGWRMSKQKIILASGSRYLKYNLQANGYRKTFLAHRVGALAWVENPQTLPQVNHIDCNKLNNYVGNLEWCTGDYNMAHASKNGLIKRGINNSTHISNRSKPVIQCSLSGKQINKFNSTREAARILNMHHSLIGKCAKGITGAAYNFKFKYA